MISLPRPKNMPGPLSATRTARPCVSRTWPTRWRARKTRAWPPYVASKGENGNNGLPFQPAIVLSVQRQPGANVISVADSVTRLLPVLQQTLPGNVEVRVVTDRTTTIRATVHDVQLELLLAVALVIWVIWLFLRNVQATIIPALAVPLSLVGSLGVMHLAGYSLNNLTLMALGYRHRLCGGRRLWSSKIFPVTWSRAKSRFRPRSRARARSASQSSP